MPTEKKEEPIQKAPSPKGKHIGIGAGAAAIVLVLAFVLLNITGIIQFSASQTTGQPRTTDRAQATDQPRTTDRAQAADQPQTTDEAQTSDQPQITEVPLIPIQPQATEDPQIKFEGPGFDTPEMAITAYVKALKSMDLRRIWSTFAIESYVEQYNLEEYLNWLNAYGTTFPQLTSPSNEFSYSGNIQKRLNDVSSSQQYMINALISGMYISFSSGYTQGDGNIPEGLNISQFISFLDKYMATIQRQLEHMAVVEIVLPDGLAELARRYGMDEMYERYSDERTQNSIEQKRVISGADEIMEVIVVLDIDNAQYILSPTVARYDDKWFMLYRNSSITIFFEVDPYLQSYWFSIDSFRIPVGS